MTDEAADPEISTIWKISYVVGCLVVFGVFAILARPDKGVVAGFSFASIVLAVRLRWDMRRQIWFWLATAALIAVHGIFVYFWGWKISIKPTILLAPVVLVDFVVVVSILFLAERLVSGTIPPEQLPQNEIVVTGNRVRRVAVFPNSDGDFQCSFVGGRNVFVRFENNGVIDRVDASLSSYLDYDNGTAIPQLTNPGSNPFYQYRASHVFYFTNIELEFSARASSSNGLYRHLLTGRGNAQPVNDVGTSMNVSVYINGGFEGCE